MNENKIEWQVGYYDKPADERLSREDCTVDIDLFDPTESDLERDRCKAALARVFELVDAGKHDITITKMDDTTAVESFRWSPEIGHVVADLDAVMRLIGAIERVSSDGEWKPSRIAELEDKIEALEAEQGESNEA